VNELRSLEHKIDEDFSHKFLRCPPKKFEIIVTIILRGGLKDLTPTQVFGEIITHDTFDHEERVMRKKRRKVLCSRQSLVRARLQEIVISATKDSQKHALKDQKL